MYYNNDAMYVSWGKYVRGDLGTMERRLEGLHLIRVQYKFGHVLFVVKIFEDRFCLVRSKILNG